MVIILKKTSEDALVEFHYDLGPIIRNDFGLWDGNEELPGLAVGVYAP